MYQGYVQNTVGPFFSRTRCTKTVRSVALQCEQASLFQVMVTLFMPPQVMRIFIFSLCPVLLMSRANMDLSARLASPCCGGGIIMTRRGIKLSRYLNILKWKSITIRTNHMQRLAQEGIRARSCNIHCSLSTLHRFARGLHDFETDSPTAWRSAK